MMTFEFLVFGDPQAKGSMKAYMPKGWTRPIVTSTNKNLKAWEQLLRQRANEVRREQRTEPITGPVMIEAHFYFARPKKYLTRRASLLDYPHLTTPDLDKLCRSLDGLNGILFLDDRQVVKIDATKQYATPGQGSYCCVRVSEHYPRQLQFGERPTVTPIEPPQSQQAGKPESQESRKPASWRFGRRLASDAPGS